MKPTLNLLLAATALCVAGTRSTAADTVSALYQFGVNTTTTYASTDADANSIASSITLGSGFTTSGISTTSGNPVPTLFLRPADNSIETNAFNGNKYIQFTISGGTLSFSSLSFDFYRDTGASAKFYALYFSTTGSFTNGTHVDANATAFSPTATWTNYSVNLSDMPGLQSVAGTATFRLYFWGATDQTTPFRLDNLTLTTASAAIPEPSTYALVVSGCLLLVTLRRNHQHSKARSS
ncbi:MAG: hypothetical protein K0R17_862 [Rariglobus sp.]|jgi:hypothetical protein|nr:hypothetical protein [Rariglobus sp.]